MHDDVINERRRIPPIRPHTDAPLTLIGIHGPYDEAGPAFQALAGLGPDPAPSGLAVYPDLFAGL